MAAFSHRPFANCRSIRLLLLKPSIYRDAPLVCSMRTFDLSAVPTYDALSYTWDNQHPSPAIQCDGRELRVTPNVASALRHLRRRLYSRYVWIDAICIDQTNLIERGNQVSMMHLIYRKASWVIVWLGAGGRDTDRAISALKWAFPFRKLALHILFLRHWSLQRFRAQRESFQHILHGDLDSRTTRAELKEYAALRHILHHHWFRRIWTLQEISLATRARLLCGNSQIKWRTLSNALTFDRVFVAPDPPVPVLMDGGYNPSTPIFDNVPFFHRMQQIQMLREWFRRAKYNRTWPTKLLPIQDQPPFTYVVNLILTGLNPGYECTDLRDRLFGLLGLLPTFGVHLPPPDYSKELPELIMDAFKAILAQYKRLDLLLFVTGEHSIPGLPSWIPDYRTVPWLGSDMRSTSKRECTPSPKPNFQLLDRKLAMQATFLDCIEDLTEPLHRAGNPSEVDSFTALDMPSRVFHSALQNWMKFCSNCKSFQGLSPIDQDTLLFNLFLHPQVIAYYESTGVPAYGDLGGYPITEQEYQSHRLFEHFRHWLRRVADHDDTLTSTSDHLFDQVQHFISSEWINTSSNFMDKELTIGYQRACLVIQRWVRENLHQKRLFRTASGAVGIGWQAVRLGDQIARIRGLTSPVVLRKATEDYGDKEYQIIGPCLIQGIRQMASVTEDEVEKIILI